MASIAQNVTQNIDNPDNPDAPDMRDAPSAAAAQAAIQNLASVLGKGDYDTSQTIIVRYGNDAAGLVWKLDAALVGFIASASVLFEPLFPPWAPSPTPGIEGAPINIITDDITSAPILYLPFPDGWGAAHLPEGQYKVFARVVFYARAGYPTGQILDVPLDTVLEVIAPYAYSQ